jgi:hypothetical protein
MGKLADWFRGKKEDELPEQFKGKTPEEIEALLLNADSVAQENVTLKQQNQDMNNRFETFGETITQLNQKVDQLTTSRGGENNNNNSNNNQEMASFITEPDRAFAERIAPVVGLVLNANASIAKQEAMRQAHANQRTRKGNIDGTLFERFETEILELAKTCSAQQLASPQTWMHLFYNVKGRHSDEIVAHNLEGKGEFFVEPTTRPMSPDVDKKPELTEQEKRIAAKMGVTAEAYLKRKQEMVVGAPESL